MPLKFDDIHEKIETGVYKLAVNDKSTRSTVWRVYRKIKKDDGSFLEHVLFCIGCKSIMSFTHKSTTNLRRHRCHLQYLKKQTFYCYNSKGESDDRKKEPDQEQHEEQDDQQSMSDELETKPSPADVAAFVAEVVSAGDSTAASASARIPDIPEIALPLDASGVEESNVYAQTWSLEYRKLSEDQKFYAKKAIDEILVLGRLRRLTLNTVPTAE
ncbi:uncharacterized protein LOC6545546 [Drosophila erecta]|uniref:BED-type domain-containing protein n=1 Tax=Drosophila erecta TaxID=7220 RepID=B3NII6_DROER|nr:uncharacterized protein LOC6545546 [Drosophila erecta]EDV52411.1 uncharacterized protein Dere_GG13372 [Drosophila erecta]